MSTTLDDETPSLRHDPYAPWRIGPYRLFASSFALAVIGSQIFATTVLWQVYELTKDPLKVGYIGLLNIIPVLCLGLFAGQLADRVSRKKILISTQFLISLCPATLAWLIHRHPHWPLALPVTYLIVLLNAIALSFGRPARASIMPTLVPKEIFGLAATWNASLFETASITGPAIGGLIIAGLGVPAALWISSGATALTVALTMFLPDLRLQRSPEPISLRSLSAGIRFVYRVKLLLAMMTLDLLAVLFGGATALLPFFAERLGTGSAGFGFLKAAPSIGAVTMAVYLAHAPPMKRAGRWLICALMGYGVATIVFGLSQSYALSLLMLAVTGAADNVSVVIRHTLVQTLTPDSMRGRVSSVNQIFIASSNELGTLESGAVAKLFGPVFAVVSGGVGAILTVIGVVLLWPDIKRLGKLSDVQESARDEEEIDPMETVVPASKLDVDGKAKLEIGRG